MSNEPFFTRTSTGFQPTAASRGPWDPKSLHGRVIAGLLGYEIERTLNDPAFVPARLTVDMYRLPDLSAVEVTTRMVRDGGRLKVIDAEFFSAGVSMARATCQLLRKTENPPGKVWEPPNWDAPPPDTLPEPDEARGMGGMWATKPITGAFGGTGKRELWMSEVRELIEGVPLTPFTRAALAADFASPFANAGDQGLGYINSDITLYLHRLPESAWIGFQVVNHHATDGVAIGECFLYDERGPIGSSTVCALAQRRRMS
ncbi:MAG TPA: acyl-CoA thioesterase domain-containing protein [Caulobacteraceae bacterium]|nr:acyl-CoA thioesterase domain-containing protein [Caulobacteraceae bacterium]